MFEISLEWLGEFGTAISMFGLIGAVILLVCGLKSENREWLVRAILVTAAIFFLMGTAVNNFLEYRFLYNFDQGGVNPSRWLSMVTYLRQSEMTVHVCSVVGLSLGLILQLMSVRRRSSRLD